MTKNKKTIFILLALAMFFAACVSAKTYIVDYQGSEMGNGYPKWVSLLENLAGENTSGKIKYCKCSKKLYKNINVETDKMLYFAIQESSDKDIAKVKANQAARAVFADGKDSVNVSGLNKVVDFWQKENIGGELVFRHYVIFAL